jgi:hypothetical protein
MLCKHPKPCAVTLLLHLSNQMNSSNSLNLEYCFHCVQPPLIPFPWLVSVHSRRPPPMAHRTHMCCPPICTQDFVAATCAITSAGGSAFNCSASFYAPRANGSSIANPSALTCCVSIGDVALLNCTHSDMLCTAHAHIVLTIAAVCACFFACSRSWLHAPILRRHHQVVPR